MKNNNAEHGSVKLQKTKLQVVYFPYIFLRKRCSVSFLNITLRNLEDALENIKENNLRAKIKIIMNQNTMLGKPIEDIGIIEFKGREYFRPLGDIEEKRINEFRNVIFIAGVAKCNTDDGTNAGLSILTSENFRVVFQNFILESEYTGYRSGRIVNTSDFGYKISEMKYEKPSYVLRNPFSCEEKLLKALKQLRRKNRKSYRIIIRATDAMMNAYSNSEDVSNGSRILELSRAFEILFGLPEINQRMKFKEAIEKYCVTIGEKRRRYLSERAANKKEYEMGYRQVMWADRFYVLRNHIIHGQHIKSKSYFFYAQPHYHLGLWFFIVAVKQIINESMGKTIFHDSIKCKTGRFIYDNGFMKAAVEKAYKTLLKMRRKAVK